MLIRLSWLLSLLCFWMAPLAAQEDPFAADNAGHGTSLRLQLAETVEAGQETDLRLTVALPPKKHLYSFVTEGFGGITTLELTGEGFEVVGDTIEPKPHTVSPDYLAGEKMHYHEGVFTVTRRIRITDPGAFRLKAAIAGQVCDDTSCVDLILDLELDSIAAVAESRDPLTETTLDEAKAKPDSGTESVTDPEKETPEDEVPESLWAAFWGGFLGGLIALITPCVFPMIPITISMFMKQSEKQSGSLAGLGLVYALGVVVCFVAIGMAVAKFMGGNVNDLVNNPWLNVALGIVFTVFAMSFFGAFDLQPPQWLLNLTSGGRNSKGYGGAVLMGITFAVTSFTCTVPIVGSALALSVQDGSVITPVVVMLGFSGAIGGTVFLLSLFPGLLETMPKSGGWLGNAKVILGFFELMLAVKFIRSADIVWRWGIFSHDVVLLIWTVILLLVTLYTLGLFRMSHDGPIERVGVVRIFFVMVFGFSTLYIGVGALGVPLNDNIEGFLLQDPKRNLEDPDRDYDGFKIGALFGKARSGPAELKEYHPEFLNDYEGALAEAQSSGRRLFIEFTGET